MVGLGISEPSTVSILNMSKTLKSITYPTVPYPTIGEFTLKGVRVRLKGRGFGLSSLFLPVFMNDFHMDFWVQLLWSDFFPGSKQSEASGTVAAGKD